MGNKGAAKKGKAAAEAAKVAGEEHVAMPPTPEHTTNGDFETDDCEAEIAEPTTSTASQEKGKKKAPAAKTSGKAASSGGTKRTSDGLKKESSKKKPAQASENTTPPTTVRPASSNDAMYVTLQISPSLPMGPRYCPPLPTLTLLTPDTSSSAFTSPVFDIFVGPNKYQFSAHQAILAQSPVLEKLCTIQSTKKGRARTCLLMPRENPTNIAALLQYLYRGQLRLDIPVEPTSGGETSSAGTAEEELIVRTAKKLAKLHCVGVAYELSDLQSHVTKLLHESKLWEKLRGMEFFELAERLYPEDPDEADGDSFAKFFADVGTLISSFSIFSIPLSRCSVSLLRSHDFVQHAPAKMKTVPENRISDLMRMIGSGGAFAEAIFMAFNTAARSGLAKASKLKVEEELQQGMKVQRDEVVQEENGNRHRDKRAKVEHEGVEGGDDGPAEGGPAGGGPAKDGPVEGGPVEGVSAEGGSAEDGPVEGGPVEGVSAEGGSAEDGPIEGGPAEGGPAEGGPES